MAKDVFVIKFKIDDSRYKEDKVKRPPKPIKRSKYANYLFQMEGKQSGE